MPDSLRLFDRDGLSLLVDSCDISRSMAQAPATSTSSIGAAENTASVKRPICFGSNVHGTIRYLVWPRDGRK